MSPKEVANSLRSIASVIDGAEKPRLAAVVCSLRLVVAGMSRSAAGIPYDKISKLLADAQKAITDHDDPTLRAILEELGSQDISMPSSYSVKS